MTDRVLTEDVLRLLESAAQDGKTGGILALIASHRLQAARIQELEKEVKELEVDVNNLEHDLQYPR